MTTPQQNWNAANLNKIKAAGEKRDKKRVRVVLSFYRDRPSDVALLDWLKSQAGDGSVAGAMTKILRENKMNVERFSDFLSEAQMGQARSLYRTSVIGTFVELCVEQVLQPNLAEIEQKAGRKIDVQQLAYQLEHNFGQMKWS